MSVMIITKPGKPAEEIQLRKETQKEIEDILYKCCGREWKEKKFTDEEDGGGLCCAFPAHQEARGLQRNRMDLKGCICWYWVTAGGQKAGIHPVIAEEVKDYITLRSSVPVNL